MASDLLTTTEAARRLGLSPGRVRHFIDDGRLPATKAGRDWQIDPQHLESIPRKKRGRKPTEKTTGDER